MLDHLMTWCIDFFSAFDPAAIAKGAWTALGFLAVQSGLIVFKIVAERRLRGFLEANPDATVPFTHHKLKHAKFGSKDCHQCSQSS